MPSGILIIDKSPGWTSQDAAAKLRGLYGERRVGHGGTLDPMATGVLPVFLGRATRAVEFFEHAEKEYVAGVRLGLTTDTEDTSGAVLSEQPVHVAEAQVRAAVEALAGEREQVPPMYSAVKIGGRKLYELARAGKEIERKARRITVIESELLDGGAPRAPTCAPSAGSWGKPSAAAAAWNPCAAPAPAASAWTAPIP